jgi:hypothetical protein
MATTRIVSTLLAVGENVVSAAFAPDAESVSLTANSTQSGTAQSQVRFLVKDANGLVLGSSIILGTNSKRITLGSLDGNITVEMECLAGSATVSSTESDGGAIDTADIATDAVTGAKILDLTVDTADIAADAITQAKINAAAVDTTELAAGAATLPKFDHTGIKILRFDGVAAAGPCTLTGAAVGDRVMAVFGVTTATSVMVVGGTNFEATITVVDQIQQSLAGDLSGDDYVAILIPAQA